MGASCLTGVAARISFLAIAWAGSMHVGVFPLYACHSLHVQHESSNGPIVVFAPSNRHVFRVGTDSELVEEPFILLRFCRCCACMLLLHASTLSLVSLRSLIWH